MSTGFDIKKTGQQTISKNNNNNNNVNEEFYIGTPLTSQLTDAINMWEDLLQDHEEYPEEISSPARFLSDSLSLDAADLGKSHTKPHRSKDSPQKQTSLVAHSNPTHIPSRGRTSSQGQLDSNGYASGVGTPKKDPFIVPFQVSSSADSTSSNANINSQPQSESWKELEACQEYLSRRRIELCTETRDPRRLSLETILNVVSGEKIPWDTLINATACPESVFRVINEEPKKLPPSPQNSLLGLKVLLRLSPALQRSMYHLVQFPFLLIENLFLLEEWTLLGDIFQDFAELRKNVMILHYTRKALSFPTADFQPPFSAAQEKFDTWVEEISPSQKLIANWNYLGMWRGYLTIDETQNEQIYNTHYFSSGTPNLGQNCLDLVTLLSEEIPNYTHRQQTHLLSMSKEILRFTKLKIGKMENTKQEVALIDALLHDVEFLEMLYREDVFSIKLADLTELSSLRRVRDTLVKQKLYSLALEICTKYHIEADDVWESWGLALLKSQDYQEARQKLKHKLYPLKQRNIIGLQHALRNIIEALGLTTEPPTSSSSPSSQTDLTKEMNQNEKKQNSKNDPQKMAECVFYLTQYGTVSALFQFHLHYGQIEAAIKLMVEHRLSPAVFVRDLIEGASPESVANVFGLLSKYDETQQLSKQYCFAAATYFNKMSDLKQLLFVQEFMLDHARAGITSIRLYLGLDPKEQEARDQYLQHSRSHFSEELKRLNQNNSASNYLSVEDVNRYLDKISLQRDVGEAFARNQHQHQHIAQVGKATLFGPTVQRVTIAKTLLLMGELTLGMSVFSYFELDPIAVFQDVIISLVLEDKFSEIRDVMEKGWAVIPNDGQWDSMVMSSLTVLSKLDDEKFAQQKSMAEALINLLKIDANKIEMLILFGKLKAAYLIAVRLGLTSTVVKIRDEAKSRNLFTETQLCDKYLEKIKE